jgi:nucleotide-binding universal stress UspA family protein
MSKPIPSGTIVVGVDDTQTSDRALLWAAGQASRDARSITVVHATGPTTSAYTSQPGLEHGRALESLRAEGHQVTVRSHRTLTRHGFTGDVHHRVVAKSPAKALIDASTDAALVVVGARKPGPLGMFLMGSVSRALVGHTRCPVIVVPAESSPGSRPGVLVAVDDTERRHAALDFAFQQAAARGTRLTVLGCLLTPTGVYAGADAMDPTDWETQQQRRRLAESIAGYAGEYPDVITELEVDRGPVDEAVVKAAHDKDLIVIGARVHSRLAKLLTRDVDRWVIRHAPCPVAIVPEAEAL